MVVHNLAIIFVLERETTLAGENHYRHFLGRRWRQKKMLFCGSYAEMWLFKLTSEADGQIV